MAYLAKKIRCLVVCLKLGSPSEIGVCLWGVLSKMRLYVLACRLFLSFTFLQFSQRYSTQLLGRRDVEINKGQFHNVSFTKNVLVFHLTAHDSSSVRITNFLNRISDVLRNVNFSNFYRVIASKQSVKFYFRPINSLYHMQTSVCFIDLIRIADLIPQNVCRRSAHICEFQLMPQMIPVKDFFFIHNRPTVSCWTMPPIAELPTNRNEFGYDPGSFSYYHCISTRFGSIRGSPRNYGLPNENAKANESPDNPPDGCLHITSVEHIERVIFGFLFFALCLWLFYYVAWRSLATGNYLAFCRV